MPTGDTLKKVRPGDPLKVPAGAYNAFVDAALAHRQAGPGVRRGARLTEATAGCVTAYNASGEDAPWGGVVELRVPQLYEHEEFVKPGHADGVGVYAVALAPIASGTWERVAVTGGPWRLAVSGSPEPGETVGQTAGAWTAGSGTTWTVSRAVASGVIEAFFSRRGVFSGTPSFAYLDVGAGAKHLGEIKAKRRWTGADASAEVWRGIVQFESAASLASQARWALMGDGRSMTILLEPEGSGHFWGYVPIYVAVITESFDLATDSYAALAALTTGAVQYLAAFRADRIGVATGRTADVDCELLTFAGRLNVIPAYGLCVSIPHWTQWEVPATYADVSIANGSGGDWLYYLF